MEIGNAEHAIHLIDLTADHYFGERQVGSNDFERVAHDLKALQCAR
jgi:hypothetical protein